MERTVQVQVPGEALPRTVNRLRMLNSRWEEQGQPVWVAGSPEESSPDLFTVTLTTTELSSLAGSLTVWGTWLRTSGRDGVVSPAPGLPVSEVPTVNDPDVCIACGTRRARKHLLVEGPDGAVVAVGERCLDNYVLDTVGVTLGRYAVANALTDPVVLLESTIRSVVDADHYDTERVLACAMSLVDKFGYTSRRDAMRSGGMSTGEQIVLMLDYSGDGGSPDIADRLFPAAVLRACVLDEMTADSEFSRLMLDTLARPAVTRHAFGVIAAVPVAYERFTRDQEAQREGRPTLNTEYSAGHVGTVGERVQVPVQVDQMRVLPSGSTLVVFRSDSGNRLTWFATAPAQVFTPGARGVLTATVKAHKTFNGVDDTVVNRCLLSVSA